MLNDGKIRPQLIQTLMMGTVDQHSLSVQLMQEGAGKDARLMKLILALIFMEFMTLHMLMYGAPKEDINKLHTLADSEYRLLIPDGLL